MPPVPLEAARADEAAQVLAAAFADDPVLAWATPDRAQRVAGLPGFFGELVPAFLPGSSSLLAADGAGAALWNPPGRPLVAPEQAAALFERLAATVGDPERLLVLQVALHEVHPERPHHYLGFLGVLPGRQGQGVGGALLAPVLARCDAAGEPAYLEATTRESTRLYARHGFVETGEVAVPDGPSLWPMWREPAVS